MMPKIVIGCNPVPVAEVVFDGADSQLTSTERLRRRTMEGNGSDIIIVFDSMGIAQIRSQAMFFVAEESKRNGRRTIDKYQSMMSHQNKPAIG